MGRRTVRRPRWFAELGIPPEYGIDPPLPAYTDAERLEDVEPNIIGRMERLAPRTAQDWRAMKAAAAEDGVQLLLVSGFRSISRQIALIRAKLARGDDIEAILRANAAPGYSQHHTGRAVDIATPGCRPLTEAFAHSEAFFWLEHNASRFGFRMPYDRGNAFGFAFEPWHWSQLDDGVLKFQRRRRTDASRR
ncbi:MAG TPA: M15 family metallopeptidase [Gammaproteobacteria bacterium]